MATKTKNTKKSTPAKSKKAKAVKPKPAATKKGGSKSDAKSKATPPKRVRSELAASANDLADSGDRKLGSRVTSRQGKAIEETLKRLKKSPAKVTSATKGQLRDYGVSGERDVMPEKAYGELKSFVKEVQASELLENDSQRRRVWPRKVAAVLASIS